MMFNYANKLNIFFFNTHVLINIIARQLLLYYTKSACANLVFKMLTSKMLRGSAGFLHLTTV